MSWGRTCTNLCCLRFKECVRDNNEIKAMDRSLLKSTVAAFRFILQERLLYKVILQMRALRPDTVSE